MRAPGDRDLVFCVGMLEQEVRAGAGHTHEQ